MLIWDSKAQNNQTAGNKTKWISLTEPKASKSAVSEEGMGRLKTMPNHVALGRSGIRMISFITA